MERAPFNLDAVGCIRTRKVLHSLGVQCVADLRAVTPGELMATRHARPRCLETVRRFLEETSIGDTVRPWKARVVQSGYDTWPLVDRRLYLLQADTRHLGRDRYFVRSSLKVASHLVDAAARCHAPLDLDRQGVERVLGPEDEPSFELRLWRLLRAVSYEQSGEPARRLFLQVAWAFMDAVPWSNFRLGAACMLARSKGADEWKAASEFVWGRIFRELDRRHPQCQGQLRTWPPEFEMLSYAMQRVSHAWLDDEPLRSLSWLTGGRGAR